MQRPILQLGHPVLRQQATALRRDQLLLSETQDLINDMIDTMRAAGGAGLAAPQIGKSLRICVAEVEENARYPQMPPLALAVWVNPQVETLGHDVWVDTYEGCLSVPGLRGRVRRPGHIRLTYWDRTGTLRQQIHRGATAAVVGHECDHLDGTLFVDRADPKSLCFPKEYEQFVPQNQRLRVSDTTTLESE